MIRPRPATPIGQRETGAFVSRANGSGFETLTLPVYPESPRGAALRRMRVGSELGLRETAKALGVSAAELSGLELGRYQLSDDEWTEASLSIRKGGNGGWEVKRKDDYWRCYWCGDLHYFTTRRCPVSAAGGRRG